MQWDGDISFHAWDASSADEKLRGPGTTAMSVREYSLALERSGLNTTILKLASTTVKCRAILHVDGFLSSMLKHLFNVCGVVRQRCSIICFSSRRDSTDT